MVNPALLAISIAFKVSVKVPIWFNLINIELPTPLWIPSSNLEVLVTNR